MVKGRKSEQKMQTEIKLANMQICYRKTAKVKRGSLHLLTSFLRERSMVNR